MGVLGQLKEELKYEIFGIALIALGILSIVCLLSPASGLVSGFIDKILKSIAGEGRYMFPLLLLLVGVRLVHKRSRTSVSERMYGVVLLFLVVLAFFHLIIPLDDSFQAGVAGDGGGVIGALMSYICRKSFGIVGTYIILITLGLIGLLLLTNLSAAAMAKGFSVKTRETLKKVRRA